MMAKRKAAARPRLVEELRARLESPIARILQQSDLIVRLLAPLEHSLAPGRFGRISVNDLGERFENGVVLENAAAPVSNEQARGGSNRRFDQKQTKLLVGLADDSHAFVRELTRGLEVFSRTLMSGRSSVLERSLLERGDKKVKAEGAVGTVRNNREFADGREEIKSREAETPLELLRMTREILSRHDALEQRLDRDLPAEARYAP